MLWENFNQPNIHVIGVSKRGGGREVFEETMAKASPNYENYKPTDPTSMNNKYKKREVNNTRHIRIV